MAKKVLLGLIVVTAAAFSFVYAAAQAYPMAVLAFGLGLIWLVQEIHRKTRFGSFFFLSFLALAVVASLSQAPIPVVLLGVSVDLAAWDLSRFRARIAGETASDAAVLLETKHLQKLAVTACAGFFIALLPVFIQISIHFVVLLIMILLVMIAFRRSMLSLRGDPENRG